MGTKIVICGLNGAGKSTLGKTLADMLHYHFIDIEELYFQKALNGYLYDSPHSRQEVELLFANKMETYSDVVFAAVKCTTYSFKNRSLDVNNVRCQYVYL